ncbi:hypothetical protein X801_07973, partial [Opisthorchis viverrini]
LSELTLIDDNFSNPPPHRLSQTAHTRHGGADSLVEPQDHQSSDTLDPSDVALLFRWLTSILTVSHPVGDPLFDFLEGLDTFFSACRERCRFPQLEVHLPGDKAQPGSVLNDLIASLLNNFKRLSQQSRGGAATVHGEVRIFKTLNAISSAIGSILFGNLQLIRKDLLIELTWALLTEANSRMDHQNSNDSHQLYVTLSHLAYLRSVWDKRETSSHSTDKQDFLSEPKLFHALLEVFVAGLRHFESLDSAHS